LYTDVFTVMKEVLDRQGHN